MSFSCNKVIEYEIKIQDLIRTKEFDLKICKNEYDQFGISMDMKIEIRERHKPYLEYHRNNVYKSA